MIEVSNIHEQIECVTRELRQRARVYPRLVDQGKMTQELADRETKRMTDALSTLEAVATLVRILREPQTVQRETLPVALTFLITKAPLPSQGSLI